MPRRRIAAAREVSHSCRYVNCELATREDSAGAAASLLNVGKSLTAAAGELT